MKYKLIVCGGTFDLLHKGHRKFLEDTLALSERALIGLTSDKYIANFKSTDIEDFDIRKEELVSFLNSIGTLERVEIAPIHQAYEPLLTDKYHPEAIAVTPQTEKTAHELNSERRKLDLPELKVEVIEMEKSDDGTEISSSRVRRGEINRDGRLYVNQKWIGKTLILPQNLRDELHKPFGKIIPEVPDNIIPKKTITIGDVTTKRFNDKNVDQYLSIVDFIVQRRKQFESLSDLGFGSIGSIDSIVVKNSHGTISPQLFESIRKSIESGKRSVVQVDGEEDLSFLPVMLTSPLGFRIYYGQSPYANAPEAGPNEGLVEVEVTEENKEKVYDLVNKFTY